MNPYLHSKISVNKRGGQISDYYEIHSFMDSTKEICSDNRHRILHNHWGIRKVIIPLFGHTIINSDGKEVNVKDMMEQDHILPDYNNRFIPVISDFVEELNSLSLKEIDLINSLYSKVAVNKKVKELMISPLTITGLKKALRLTFNPWFIRTVLPHISDLNFNIEETNGLNIFHKMNYKPWMDNGRTLPRSAKFVY